ncbi:arsenate reductase/protein-tyrosine-phosphatase family protein [Bacillus sp. FSL K6-3431]|uniref:arsenate reductase/protein-tyrosine-phosphatase family protein n=1 Tax=Bacillus sp. FSL K6-3431 TaxID=2921500 RepID=UPI0030FA842D
MNILFVCTDNFTRSVIAELCMKNYLKRTSNNSVKVASSGIRANSDISKYSNVHFKIMDEMGIETSDFNRTQFDETCFEKFDVVIGMSELHKDHIKQQYNRDICLFNEVLNGQQTPVDIGSPNSVNFLEQMNQLVMYVNNAVPYLLRNLEKPLCLLYTKP